MSRPKLNVHLEVEGSIQTVHLYGLSAAQVQKSCGRAAANHNLTPDQLLDSTVMLICLYLNYTRPFVTPSVLLGERDAASSDCSFNYIADCIVNVANYSVQDL